MTISVVLPAYNAARTLRETIDAVLAQTVPADEILVFNDGSKDDTEAVLQSYGPVVTAFTQPNGGVARARNFLCRKARGDMIAFLDADDVWHPRYLELQRQQIEAHPEAVAFFTGHSDLIGYDNYRPDPGLAQVDAQPVVYPPRDFIRVYNEAPLRFQMSCCCVPRKTLEHFGPEPFFVGASGADDTYFHNLLPLVGPVVHAGVAPVAYRVIPSSISANRLNMSLLVVTALEALEPFYQRATDSRLVSEFRAMLASRRRNCGKYLMGAGRTLEARRLFRHSFKDRPGIMSLAKSWSQLAGSYLPSPLQPKWPGTMR
jgi:glycosyltransferase involved in cell wall biosynthesis